MREKTESEWAIYAFTPQPDITAFELAMIIVHLQTDRGWHMDCTLMHRDFDEWPPEVWRHFTFKGEPDPSVVDRLTSASAG